MRLLDGINDTEDELYTFDSIIETKTVKGLEALYDAKENLKEIDNHVGFDYDFINDLLKEVL